MTAHEARPSSDVDRLLIGCPGYMRPWSAVTTVLDTVRRCFPGVEPVLVERLSGELAHELRRGSIHMALLLGPVEENGFNSVPVGKEELLVAVPASHRLAELASIPIANLRELPLVLFPRAVNPRLYDYYLDALHRAGLQPNVLEEPAREGSRAAVADGWGFTLAARSLAEHHPMAGVAHRPLAGGAGSVDVNLAWTRDNAPPIVEALTRELPVKPWVRREDEYGRWLGDARFCARDEAAALLRPYVWRRVRAALDALHTGAPRYLQNGTPPG